MPVSSKVAAGGVAGAATVVFIYVLGLFGVDLPPEVASSITVLLGFAAGYIKKETALADVKTTKVETVVITPKDNPKEADNGSTGS